MQFVFHISVGERDVLKQILRDCDMFNVPHDQCVNFYSRTNKQKKKKTESKKERQTDRQTDRKRTSKERSRSNVSLNILFRERSGAVFVSWLVGLLVGC